MTISPAPPAEKLDFKRVLPVFVIVLVDLLGLTIIIPLLPLYAAAFGATPFMIGLLGAVYPLMQFIGAPLLGATSDRWGRKPVLLVSQIGTFSGFILLGLANALPVLFISRLIDGLSGANISTAQAMISDSTTEKTRTQAMGLIGAAFGLGFTAGPLIAFASLALSGNDYHVPAFIAAGFSAVSILLTSVWLKETHTERVQAGRSSTSPAAMLRALGAPVLGFLFALAFVQQAIFGGFEQLLPLFTLSRVGLSAAGNAAIFVFVGILVVVIQGGLIRRLGDRFGDRGLIMIGLVALSLGLLLTALTPGTPLPGYTREGMLAQLTRVGGSVPQVQLPDDGVTGWGGIGWLLAAMIPSSVGGALLGPTINSAISKQSARGEVGRNLGLAAAFTSAANAFSPIAGGAMFQWLGSGSAFLAGAVVLLALWVIARARLPVPAGAPA